LPHKFDEIALYKPNIRDESFIIPSLTVSATSPGRSGPKKKSGQEPLYIRVGP